MNSILVTVGTSLLTNMQRDNLEATVQPVRLQYIREKGEQKASAETNSLRLLLEKMSPKNTKILFFHSDTEDGERCAQTLERYYDGQGYQAETRRVEGLQYRQEAFKAAGLRNLVRELASTTRREQEAGRAVHINATGGFKAEIAYATLIGLLFDVPVYYLHERFNDLIQMPPAPIAWDYSLLAEYDAVLNWLEAAGQRKLEELWNFAHQHGIDCETDLGWRKIDLILDHEPIDGHIYVALSPAGEAYYEAYRAHLERPGDPVYLTQEVSERLERLEPSKRQEIEALLQKLSHRPFWQGSAEKMRDSGLWVYPRGPRNARIAFYLDEGGNGVRVCEIAWHNDGSYDALCDRKPQAESYRNAQWHIWTRR